MPARGYRVAQHCELTRKSKRSKKCVSPYKSFVSRMGGLKSFRSSKTAHNAFKRRCGPTDRRRKAYHKTHPKTSLTCGRNMVHYTNRKSKRHGSRKGIQPAGLAAYNRRYKKEKKAHPNWSLKSLRRAAKLH